MRIGYILGLSIQTELLILSFFGILHTILDTSLLEFNTNTDKLWGLHLNPSLFSDSFEVYLKYLLYGVVIVRTFTIHIYLGTYIIMLYPLIFEDRPRLVLPWLCVTVVKCLATNCISFLSGCVCCFKYNWTKATCWEYLLLQVSYNLPLIYMFSLVLRFYTELRKFMKIHKYIDPIELKARRHRARLLYDKNILDNRVISRPLNALYIKQKEPDEYCMPTLHKYTSPTTNILATDSKWQKANVTTYSMKDAVVSGRSFRVSGAVLEVFGQARSSRRDARVEPDGFADMERIQKIQNLDSDDKFSVSVHSNLQQPATTDQATQVTPIMDIIRNEMTRTDAAPGHTTVSELLKDSNIALVLNMITGKDEPWEPDLSKLQDYEITITDEDPMWSYPEYRKDGNNISASGHRRRRDPKPLQRAEMLDGTSQVSSPHFEQLMTSVTNAPQEEAPQGAAAPPPPHDFQLPEKAHAGVGLESRSVQVEQLSQPLSVNQIYRNYASYPRSFKDDGYTQAFMENLARKKIPKSDQ